MFRRFAWMHLPKPVLQVHSRLVATLCEGFKQLLHDRKRESALRYKVVDLALVHNHTLRTVGLEHEERRRQRLGLLRCRQFLHKTSGLQVLDLS